jgi:hypothetical protein
LAVVQLPTGILTSAASTRGPAIIFPPDLSEPFHISEIERAFRNMNLNSSPGPDGFSPGFYNTFWNTIKTNGLPLFSAFYDHSLSMDGLDCAFLVLLPKKDGARSASCFRPISLQGCLVKSFAKVLTNRLQPWITRLVSSDQTIFIKERCISENFVYAAELLSCCHRRGAATIVLKLDFQKSFDSICWQSLDVILLARGFDDRWRTWVSTLLSTGCTSILLNGAPGRWFRCRRGLRQGDPLLPYLFIIVADLLKRLIAQHSNDLEHPLVPGVACHILQYADFTLILLCGTQCAAATLKRVLEDFTAATGLAIIFHKSTLVPMHVHPQMPHPILPQPYIGLPLSAEKLRNLDFQPLFAKCNKYLAGWRGRLPSTGGRLFLTNVILSSLSVYYMSTMLLPKGVIDAIDRRRHAFLWTREETCSGARCLIAWYKACLSKLEGGLGVKDLATQNHCLLLKFMHKLHGSDPVPWRTWMLADLDCDHGDGLPDNSFLRHLLFTKQQRYRALTRVVVRDSRSTSFWFDDQISSGLLCLQFPALFTHVICPHYSVAPALSPPPL